jgi:alanine racemase
MVRAGIILYGMYPSDCFDRSLIDLKPVMTFKSKVMHIKNLEKGTCLSYGMTHVLDEDAKVATVSVGYADGYSRLNSGKISVLVGGIKCPVVGNICMDQCMVDVSAVPDVKLGDEVVVLGKQGDQEISADDLAAINGTINYEITCCFDLRIPKVYINYPEGMCK